VSLVGLDLCKILKGLFLEGLVLPKILKVGEFCECACVRGLFTPKPEDTQAGKRRRKLATKNTKNTKRREKGNFRLERGDFRGGREWATNEHK
jgi:hypothetical protein